MATTMNLIAKQTIGAGGAASVTFSSIPQTFTDLKVVCSVRGTYVGPGNSQSISLNGSSANFTGRYLQGAGSGTPSSGTSTQYVGDINAANSTANTFNNSEIYIPNYTSSNNKSISVDSVTENNATTAYATLVAVLWSNTAAINSITLTNDTGTYVEFSEFTLYGISSSSTQNQTTPSAIGGDVITTDGSFWYHTFLYSGTFTPLKNLTCDYLVVAGGGGGGNNGSGGGGAGGYRTSIGGSALSLTAQAYATTVGAGGAGKTFVSSGISGDNGSNSIFSTITSTGGGGGGSNGTTAGAGGSGGGGGGRNPGGGAGGAASPSGQGSAGGTGSSNASPAYGAGGGGGSSVVGSPGTSSIGGAGGAGTANSISGTSVTYAGGGGGGAEGGSGGGAGAAGGGNGGNSSAGGNGTANSGSGAGGAGGANTGGNGGSGIIILRYAV
jgi:hypothetical protein